MELIPSPQKLIPRPGGFDLTDPLFIRTDRRVTEATVQLADEIEAHSHCRPRFSAIPQNGKAIHLHAGNSPEAEDYRLMITGDRIEIEASGERGLFYGIQTLRQIIRSEGLLLSCCEIEDRPDYPNRGFYLDLSRGRILKLEMLCRLADKLAFYKINQLQLYIEHVFQFAGHSDLWSGCDPLTAEDMILFDRYCSERYIELIPSLSTFGHCYTALRSQRKKHLNELEIDASLRPFSFHDRQVHYTLDCRNPESLEFVESMIHELAPLFRGKYFNICCDETFDLGKGRNRDTGTDVLYSEFLKKIMNIVTAHGKIPMFWGDVISQNPEIVRELPENTVVLEWDYSAECNWYDTARMQQAGALFYVCPGCNGWNTFLNDINTASANITNYARKGLRFGATGLLNTDWGDYGHVNLPSASLHGLALGAAAGWNVEKAADLNSFDRAFELLELGAENCGLCAVWREIMNRKPLPWGALQLEFDPGEKNLIPEKNHAFPPLPEFKELARRFIAICAGLHPADPETSGELAVGMRGLVLTQEIIAELNNQCPGSLYELADKARQFEYDFSRCHHHRSRPGEYWRFRESWMEITAHLDKLQNNLNLSGSTGKVSLANRE